jgi:dTDP-4-amino-4,6-dideoxygalactose transaminase
VSSTTEATATPVPFLDLGTLHRELGDGILAEIAELFESSAFTNGPQVASFEDAFAEYCGAAHAVGLASGLDALRLALTALGLEPGDEVLVPAMTFIATFEAVTQAGGVPVPVDISETDYCLDADAVEAAITARTFGLLPVHLFGQMADMVRLGELARSRGLVVVEDACQAHGAVRDGLRAGTVGEAGTFSFYPGKNLGAMGDAGALVTPDPQLAERVRALREHGQRRKYEHDLIGWTARLDTIQAIVLLHKLPHVDGWNADRRRAASYYAEALDGVGDLRLPAEAPDAEHVWHLFVVRTADPVGLVGFLTERGIGVGRHYPQPPHLTAAYAHLGRAEGAFPVAERLAAECVSLPIFPGITDEQLERVVLSVRAWFARA